MRFNNVSKNNSEIELGEERRDIRAFRNNFLPSILAALFIAVVFGIIKYRDDIRSNTVLINSHERHILTIHTSIDGLKEKVNKHEYDIVNLKDKCKEFRGKVKDIEVMSYNIKQCRKDIERLDRKLK